MKNLIKALFIVSCIFLVSACERSYTSVATQTCALHLQIAVHQGPSAEHTISGHVDFGSGTWSNFQLDFVEDNGQSYPSSFSLNGQAIQFIIELPDGRVFATGIMDSNLATCAGTGGGTLSGPQIGDLGDWRGEWAATVLPTPSAQPNTSNRSSFPPAIFCMYSPFIVIGLLLAIFLFQVLAPYKLLALFKGTSFSKQQTSSPALLRTHQTKTSRPVNGNQSPIEYLVTYTEDDRLFDLSFPIEHSAKDLGECGITIAKVLDTKSSQVTAFELWLFDTQGPQTVSKILVSQFCFSQTDTQSELEKIGQLTLVQTGAIIVLETSRLKAEAKVLQFEYEPNSPNPQSIFKKVVVQIRVWANVISKPT